MTTPCSITRGHFVSEHAQGLSVSDKSRYIEKVPCIQDPCCIAASELSKDVLPPVQCTDVFNYLVLSKTFCTSERFKAFIKASRRTDILNVAL